jgi:hypothetical protein
MRLVLRCYSGGDVIVISLACDHVLNLVNEIN